MKKNKKLVRTLIILVIFLAIGVVYIVFINTGSKCDSSNEVIVGEDNNITVHCGDTFIVEVECCTSCGYWQWDPIYNERVFELVEQEMKKESPEKPQDWMGHDTMIYRFRAIRKGIFSSIKLGCHQSFNSQETWTVVKNLRITVL